MADDNHIAQTPKGQADRGQHQEERSSPRGGGVLGTITAIYHAVMRGGELQAGFRMGIDELGQALKPFPDSIHAHAEPGGMFEPLHSDIAAARDQYAPREGLPSPGDIAKGRNFTAGERQDGHVHGQANIQTAQNEKPIQGPWTERILEERERAENGDNEQNELGRGRSLPDEQREQDRGR